MKYAPLAAEHDFAEHGKLAQDLAFALDHPVAACTKEYGSPIKERMAIFDAFCALCEKHGIGLPPLEESIREHGMLERKKEMPTENAAFLAKAQGQLASLPPELQEEFTRLTHALEVIAAIESYSGVSSENIRALLNDVLVKKAGLEPIRPDYASVTLPQHPESVRIAAQAKLLIVDDTASEMLKSHLAASGIAQLEPAWLLHEVAGYGDFKDADEKRAEVERMAAAIREQDPRVVLMDQGLRRINGSDIVSLMTREQTSKILFVANTGGNADELLRAGCVGSGNYDKGRRPKALYDALQML